MLAWAPDEMARVADENTPLGFRRSVSEHLHRVFVENEESVESPGFISSVEICFKSELSPPVTGIADNADFFVREGRVLHELADSVY